MSAPVTFAYSAFIKKLPAGWDDTTKKFVDWIRTNLSVRDPRGFNTFATGTVAPTSDKGPWFNGREWFVWNAAQNKYAPVSIGNSLMREIPIVDALPAGTTGSGLCVLRIGNKDKGVATGIYAWDGTQWTLGIDSAGTDQSGERPANWPVNTLYFDKKISGWLYRNSEGKWTTLAGTLGDVKYVAYTSWTDAMRFNPGWTLYLEGRGRVLAIADPFWSQHPDNTIERPGLVTGSVVHKLTAEETPGHDHALWSVESSDRTRTADATTVPFVSVRGTGGKTNYNFVSGYATDIADGFASGSSGSGAGHMNLQPTIYLFSIIKTF